MKAVICSKLEGPGALTVGELPDPVAGPGQVLIEVRATSLNFPDALMVQGLYQVKPPLPFSPGAELSGVVRAVGEGVTKPKVGDSVVAFAGHGGCAQLVAVDVARVAPMPEGLDFDVAAAFGLTYGTALHALRDCGHLQKGETLAVLGASGGTGIAAIECGKVMGARVIACASSVEKLSLCRAHGADETIDYSTEDLRAQLDALTQKKGVDVVFDAVGGSYTEPALRALAWRGRHLVIGFAAGEIPRPPLNLALLKERAILGVYWGDWTRKDPAGHARNMADLVAWIRNGTLKPAITERIGLDKVADAIARMINRRVMGKVVVLP
ncbi:NADPH:quinone oxidoreductase family protein [Usitatibacter palustris]|uniref:Quinone oxidoreductase 1 n=1 Tax=Usitatibacter palustris TaxID=2732487 RepID=A0A6M4H641_9PROT|nr:NADPH:quinone oxidoreductase family protein [Usitatibacter palustris]QJR13367.1 Quinone oxidoreductase 1 [Usitatibacter palustris]